MAHWPAIEELLRRLRMRDPVEVAGRADVAYDLSEGAYAMEFVGRPARLWPKEGAALWTDVARGEPLKPLQLRIALTYLLTAHAVGGRGQWEAATAAAAETRQALETAFGRDPAGLIRAARRLGGRRDQVAETAVLLDVLPRIRIRLILQEPPAEAASHCLIEWNRAAAAQLPPNAMAALLDMAATRLIDAAQ